jgi:hypothetical protein
MICDLLGVDRPTQMHKLQTDSAFRDCLILARVEIGGQQRTAHFISAEFITLWLKGIHPSKVAPEVRETLEEFRSVAVQTLRAFFFSETKGQPHSASPKQEPKAAPLPQQDEQPPTAPELLRRAAARMEQDQREAAAWQAEIQRSVRFLAEEREALWLVVTHHAPAFPGALSADHLRTLHLLLRACHLVNGQPIGDLEHELATLLGVAQISQIQEAAWERLLAWVAQRLVR